MSNDSEARPEARVLELVRGIITDVQVLINQQIALIRLEVKSEIIRARQAASFLGGGVAIVFMGVALLCGMLVHFLAWIAPGLPLWVCYGIVGAPILAAGVVLCRIGIQKFNSFNTSTAEPARNLEENVDG